MQPTQLYLRPNCSVSIPRFSLKCDTYSLHLTLVIRIGQILFNIILESIVKFSDEKYKILINSRYPIHHHKQIAYRL